MRACTTCGIEKPSEKFPPDPRVKRDGRNSQCFECKRARSRVYSKKYKADGRVDLPKKRLRDRAYYTANAEKVKARTLAYQRANAARTQEQKRVSGVYKRSRQKHRDRVRRYDQEYRTLNREALNEKARERYKRDQSVVKAVEHRRRFRKANAVGDISADQWRAVLDYHDNRCAYCLRQIRRLTMDHVVALSRGGENDPDNVVPACRSCNSKQEGKEPS